MPITMEMTLEEAQVVAALQRAVQAQKRVKEGFEGISDEAKKAAKEEAQATREIEAFARQAKQVDVTPLEKYTRQTAQLDEALKRNLLTQEQATRAKAHYKRQLDEATASQRRTFGSEALGELTSYVAGIASVTAAVDLVRQAWGKVIEEQRQAIASVERLQPRRRDLGQVVQGATEAERRTDYTQLLARADEVAIRYGMSREQAMGVVFDARSGGFEQDTNFIGAASLIMDPEAASQAVGKLPQLFGGKRTGREAVNMLMAVGKDAFPRIEELLRAAPQAATMMAPAGATPEETMAMFSVLSGSFKGPEQASERIQAAMNAISMDPELKGKGMAGIKQLAHMSDEERIARFGKSAELNQFVEKFRENEAKIDAQTKVAQDAVRRAHTEDSDVARAVRVRLSNPRDAAALAKRQAEIRNEISRENTFAIEGGNRESELALEETRMRERAGKGLTSFPRRAFDYVTQMLQYLGPDQSSVRSIGNFQDRMWDRMTSYNPLTAAATAALPLNINGIRNGYDAYAAARDAGKEVQSRQITNDPQMNEQTTVLREILSTLKENNGETKAKINQQAAIKPRR